MGYTVRVDDWRYTCWFAFNGSSVTVMTDRILGTELYDHKGDPGELDWVGVQTHTPLATARMQRARERGSGVGGGWEHRYDASSGTAGSGSNLDYAPAPQGGSLLVMISPSAADRHSCH